MDDNRTYFRVGLNDEVTAMLLELAEACHCQPTSLIAAILEDVLIDDLIAHGGTVHADPPTPTYTLN